MSGLLDEFVTDTSTYPSRTICEVLNEIRALYKTCNFGAIPGLVEELQMLADRMEAKLDTQKTYFQIRDEIRKLKTKRNELQNEVNLLNIIKENK